jgi:RimJ/RimL family protein N-acetyltransferase
MGRGPELRTGRLTLRRWRDSDLPAFTALNSDPDVMEHFPSMPSESQTAEMIGRFEAHFESRGFGLWAVEHNLGRRFIGFAGLSVPRFESHFTPAVEVGWRLAKEQWGNGFATEAARAAVSFGFDVVELDEIVSFAIPANVRSIRVMQRLGMTNDPADDFDHPRFLQDDRLRHHVLYRLNKQRWSELNSSYCC